MLEIVPLDWCGNAWIHRAHVWGDYELGRNELRCPGITALGRSCPRCAASAGSACRSLRVPDKTLARPHAQRTAAGTPAP